MKKKLVVLSGAGISAESGIRTFRGSDGLWEGHDVTEVASPQGWLADRSLVLDFYNQRRKQIIEAEPNEGHIALKDLEHYFEVVIITQNIDDLHERAGSQNVLHLHGEILKARSTLDEKLIYNLTHWELKEGDKCEKGSQLRPHIVWFGEAVPMMEKAAIEAASADIFLVVGTSLMVYPAASLLDMIAYSTPKYVLDPNLPITSNNEHLHLFEEPASTGMKKVKEHLLTHYV